MTPAIEPIFLQPILIRFPRSQAIDADTRSHTVVDIQCTQRQVLPKYIYASQQQKMFWGMRRKKTNIKEDRNWHDSAVEAWDESRMYCIAIQIILATKLEETLTKFSSTRTESKPHKNPSKRKTKIGHLFRPYQIARYKLHKK